MKKNFPTAAELFLSTLDTSNWTANTFPVQKITEELIGILQLQNEQVDRKDPTRHIKNATEKKVFLSKVAEWVSAKDLRKSVEGEVFHTLVDKCINLYDFLLSGEKIHTPYPNNIPQLKLRQENAFKLMEGKYPWSLPPIGYTLDKKTATLIQNEESSDDLSQLLIDYVATGKITSEEAFIKKCNEYDPKITTEIIVDRLFEKESDRSWLLLAGCFWYPSHGIVMPIPYTLSPHITLEDLWQIIQRIYSKKKRGDISYESHLEKYTMYIKHLKQQYPDRWKQTGQGNIDFLDQHITPEEDDELPKNMVSLHRTTIPQEYILNFKQANAFFEDGHYKEALDLYREASTLCPNFSAPKDKIKQILSILHQEVSNEVLSIDPDRELPEDIAEDLKTESSDDEEENPLDDGKDPKKQKRKSKKNRE